MTKLRTKLQLRTIGKTGISMDMTINKGASLIALMVHIVKFIPVDLVVAREKLIKAIDAQLPKRMVKFNDLPKGTRFKYPDGDDVWVVLEEYGDGLIAKWNGVDQDSTCQSLCCFVDDEDWTLDSEVEIIQ
jgi:hypothetical protein